MSRIAYTFVLDPDKQHIQDSISKALIHKAGFATVTRDVRPFQLRYRCWDVYAISLAGISKYHWDLLAADVAVLINGYTLREVLALDSFTADAIESWGVARPYEYRHGWLKKLRQRLDNRPI